MSHQLFELAALQSTDEVMLRERFRLDELVTDAVQKFEFNVPTSPVALERPAPGPWNWTATCNCSNVRQPT